MRIFTTHHLLITTLWTHRQPVPSRVFLLVWVLPPGHGLVSHFDQQWTLAMWSNWRTGCIAKISDTMSYDPGFRNSGLQISETISQAIYFWIKTIQETCGHCLRTSRSSISTAQLSNRSSSNHSCFRLGRKVGDKHHLPAGHVFLRAYHHSALTMFTQN